MAGLQSASMGLNDSVALTPMPTTTGHYRQRESTQYRGVTKTSGTNSGVEKFDVQFVFCDSGTKKHPKIYGFSSAQSAARAFDILTCKRALEKNRSVATVMGSAQALGTNHPTTDYANEPLLTLLNTNSRDDIIYALKQCAKRGHGLEPDNLIAELQLGLEASRAEAAEKERMGDTRQSYEPTAKPSSERKRKPAAAGGSSHRLPPLNQSISSRQQAAAAQQVAAAAAAAQQQQQEDTLMALMAGLPYGGSQQKGRPGSLASDELHASLQAQQSSQLINSADVAGLAALAAGLLRGAPGDPDAGRAAARLAAAAAGASRPAAADLRLPAMPSAALGSLSGILPPVAVSAGPTVSSQNQQLMLLQMLQAQVGSGQQPGSGLRPPGIIKSEPVAGEGALLEGKDFLLECIRLGMASSPELSCAHDLVRIWAYVVQGKAWANEQYNLPQWYYMGLVPHLQACSSLSALLAFCGQLWQAGALRVMLAAFAGNLPQPTVITLLQSVAAAAGPAVPRVPSPAAGTALKQHQDQAAALVAAALQHVQQQEREQQQLGALKAAAALLGTAPPLSTPGQDAAGPALLQQVLQMLGGGGAAAVLPGADSQLNVSQERPAAADGLADGQSQLLHLMQLLGGAPAAGAAAGAAEAPAAGAGAAANTGLRSGSPAPTAAAAAKAGQARSPSRREGREGSPSTETDGSSNGTATEEAPAVPGKGEAQASEAAATKHAGDGAAAVTAEPDENAKGEARTSPAPAAKKARTGGLSEADAATLAAAAEALGANGKISPSAGSRAPPAGPPFRSVRLDSGGGMPAPGAHPFAALAAAVGAAAAAAGAAAGNAGGTAPSAGPTRPQPLKAASRDLNGLPNGGSMAASFGGGSVGGQLAFGNKSWAPGASVGAGGTNGSKLDLLSKAASIDVGKQPSSAFSRFQQQQQQQQAQQAQQQQKASGATSPPA